MRNRTKQLGFALGVGAAVFVGYMGSAGQYISGPMWWSSDTGSVVTSSRRLSVAGLINTAASYSTAVLTVADTGTQNNYAPANIDTASRIRWSGASALTITGIRCTASADCAAADDGRELEICNFGTSGVALTNESGSSTAANRILALNNVTATLASATSNNNSCAILRYDGTSTRWRLVALATQQLANINITSTLTVSSTAHIRSTGTSPTLSSCGTSPSIAGGDTAFRVTIGTSASNACTMTFSATYTNAPSCVVYPEGAAAAPRITTSATAIVFGTAVTDSGVYHVHCHGVI